VGGMFNVKWGMLNCPDERRFTDDEFLTGHLIFLVALVLLVSRTR